MSSLGWDQTKFNNVDKVDTKNKISKDGSYIHKGINICNYFKMIFFSLILGVNDAQDNKIHIYVYMVFLLWKWNNFAQNLRQ